MSSPFGDDAAFPDRPNTPDFWRLSSVVLQLDGASTEGGESIEASFEDRVDLESVNYMAEQRVALMISKLPLPTTRQDVMDAMHAMFMTGVLTGVVFEREGGHRA